jgi:hypothetical protein
VRQFTPLLCAILCAALAAGCATNSGPGVHAGEPYVVTSDRALFYTFGPSQATGPDFALPKGTPLTMLSYQYGYSHVAIVGTDTSGYVGTDDVGPAPRAPSASPTATPRRGSGSRPRDNLDESQIPLPQFPESEPPSWAPPFRY